MTDIIEAAINTAMEWTPSPYDIDTKDREAYGVLVDEILKVVTPLIRAAALEEAAKILEGDKRWTRWRPAPGSRIQDDIAAAIRALKEQP